MNYNIKLQPREAEITEIPDVYIHFGHNPFQIVWNQQTKTQDIDRSKHTFYGGMGEGSAFETWQDAIHSSLYDAFQCYDEIKDGDTFTAEYLGETAKFVCDGIHVVKA